MHEALFLSVALSAVLPVAAAPTAPQSPLATGCAAARPHLADTDTKAEFRRLDQLPPAAEMLTVLRSVGGCQKPVIVRYGIGGNPRFGGQPSADGTAPGE